MIDTAMTITENLYFNLCSVTSARQYFPPHSTIPFYPPYKPRKLPFLSHFFPPHKKYINLYTKSHLNCHPDIISRRIPTYKSQDTNLNIGTDWLTKLYLPP